MIKYIKYLQKLKEIGEKTNKYANLFGGIGELEVKNLDELKLKKEAYRAANLGYIECTNDLKKLSPHQDFLSEHQKIIEGYQSMVDGVEYLCNSIDLELQQIDLDLYNIGLEKLDSASKEVQNASDSIVSKIS